VSSTTELDLRFHEGPWTEADYLALPGDRGRIELLDGGLLVNPSASSRHQRLSSRLWLALETARPQGTEVLEAVNLRVAPSRILVPDLMVVTEPGSDRIMWDPADVLLVIEIVSPGSVAADRAIKPPLYASAGIPHYLRIELERWGPSAVSYRLEGGAYAVVAQTRPGQVLRQEQPFPAEVDLTALLAADRPPGR
jgi:Uma2 family endonuclease